MHRGQLSLSAVEAGIAALLVLSVAALFLAAPGPVEADGRLDRHAEDLAALLVTGSPARPPLREALVSETAFATNRAAIATGAHQAIPPMMQYRIETPYGAIGTPRPAGVASGQSRRVTAHGVVTVWVWYV
ncbi:MAG: hypothetical protein ABEJ27_07160 [Halodesulfurarchaeum sp.]